MEGGSSIHVSDFVNFVVGDSWFESPEMASFRRDDVNLLPVFKDGSLDHFEGSDEDKIFYMGEVLASSAFESGVDGTGMGILSSIFKPSFTTFYLVSRDSILNVKRRLAQVRRVAVSKIGSTLIENLATELVNLSSCDKWLLNRIQTHDFDGTWVSIICGLYQSLYLYHTEIVEEHLLSCPRLSNKVLPKAKVMVLLLRRQHLQNFERLVVERHLESDSANLKIPMIEMLSDKDFLVESLISSLRRTVIQMGTWASDKSLISFIIGQEAYNELDFIYSQGMEFTEAIESQLERKSPLMKFFLANIFCVMLFESDFDLENTVHAPEKMIFSFDDDKWLWQYLHGLKEASNLLGNWSAIICALYQGQFLYNQMEVSGEMEFLKRIEGKEDKSYKMEVLNEIEGKEDKSHKMEVLNEIEGKEDKSYKMEEGKLTILLFRSIHLQNFERKLKEFRRSILQKMGGLHLDDWHLEQLVMSLGIYSRAERQDAHRQQGYYDCKGRRMHVWRLLEGIWQGSIMATENMIRSCVKEGPRLHSLDREHPQTEASHNDNVYLGSSCLPNGIKVEECLDLKLVCDLGGLICTIEGDPSSNKGNDSALWCIIRHNSTNLYFCMDMKDDEYKNKQRMLDGTIFVDYEGMVEVSTTDGQTMVKSIQLDGSCYDGELEDFADKRRKKPIQSCAEKALHSLPQSGFLHEFNLKCSVLHMFALAYLAGNKDYLTLKWRGDAGHVEYGSDLEDGSLDQSEGAFGCALQKCSVLYTHEGRLIGEDIIWEGDCDGPSQDKNGEGLKVSVSKTETTTGERDKVHIITKHYTSYVQRGLIQDSVIMCEDEITTRLIETCKEAEEALLVPADIASAFVNLKQNSGLGVGVAGVKIEGHHEYRPRDANIGIEKFLQGPTVKQHLKATVVVLPDLYQCIVDDLQTRFTSGTIAEHPREFFVVKTRGSCSLQVFLCNPQDVTQGFNWLTDIVLSDKNVAENIFKNKLTGKTMRISRTDSQMLIDPDIPAGRFFSQKIQKSFLKQQGVITEETMVHAFKLQSFPPSNDEWKFIVGERRKYHKENYFWKATECQAIVCSGTRFSTGGALVRSMKQRCDSSQPSTSSSSGAAQQLKWLFHGSCEKVCRTSNFGIGDDKVIATGKFSTFKGISNWPDVYWG